jgi:hypothetical protein
MNFITIDRTLETYHRQIRMADHLHDARNLVSCNNAPPLAFCSNLIPHSILFCFENSGLVQTNRGRVNTHVAKNDVGICNPLWQSKIAW